MQRLSLRAGAGALAALLLAAPAGAWIAQKGGPPAASTTVVLLSQLTTGMSASADRYIPVGYAAPGGTADSILSVFPVAGSISSIRAYTSIAPTGSAQWVLTLRKNGADTALTCTITSATSSSCTASSSISFAAGDYASVGIHPVNTPGVTGNIKVSLVFAPTTANDTPLFAQAIALSNSTTQAVDAQSNFNSLGNLATRIYTNVPDGGTVDKLYVASNAPGTGTSYAYTMGKNGSTTTLTCTIADTATSCNDTTHSASVTGPSGGTPGNSLQFQGAPTATPASATAGFGVRYLPTTAGSFGLIGSLATTDNASSTLYYPLTGGQTAGNTTETTGQSVADHMTITKISVKLSAAPGTGKSFAWTLRKNGTDTALTCTVSDTATACNATGSISVADGDLLDTAAVPSGTPTTSIPAISYLANR